MSTLGKITFIKNISQQAYKLYDDSFCNLDLCDNMRITDFFMNYGLLDNSVKPGIIYIYMLEKINYQNGYLDAHLNCNYLLI
jgi:hypothetical protein